MRRTSKFSFSGRRHTTTTTREDMQPVPAPSTPTIASNQHLSKAQRLLGTTNDLNIDSPIRETIADYSWRNIEPPKSSGMSITIAESIHSRNDKNVARNWDQESGVFPHDHRVQRKVSSTTLLGPRQGIPMSSDGLRHNDSSSTLKSHYDRLNSPLSISQQTSASSARDQALRKGLPPINQRSSLLNMESSIDRYDSNFSEKLPKFEEEDMNIPDKMRKKPSRLDLSKLFPRSRKHSEKSPAGSTTSYDSSTSATNNSRNSSQPPATERNKLKKSPSRESLQTSKSHRFSVRTSRSDDPQIRNRDVSLPDLYDHENGPTRGPQMDRIPEASTPEPLPTRVKRETYVNMEGLPASNRLPTRNKRESYVNMEGRPASSKTSSSNYESVSQEPFSWKNVRASIMVPSYNDSSAASISSRATKTSRRTATSIRSQTDIKDKSMLSLSSDSEEDDMFGLESSSTFSSSNQHTHPLQAPHQSSSRPVDSNRRPPISMSTNLPDGMSTARRNSRESVSSSVRNLKQNLLPVPEAISDSLHIAGPWPKPPTTVYEPQERQYRGSILKEKRTSRQASIISSIGSHHEPTPPLTPSSLSSSRQGAERESRFMAVTQQEEALLEALRQKRARMREEIIEEHCKTPSPPSVVPNHSASKYSTTSTNTTKSTSNHAHPGKERIRQPLFLDAPLQGMANVELPEPSPDLSDFLSFGSDATPRHSWAPSKESAGSGRERFAPGPFVASSSHSRGLKEHSAKISAVGVSDGMGRKRSVVRFVDDGKGGSEDEEENGVIWGI